MASYQEEVKQYVKEMARRDGWRVEPTSDGYQLKYKDGATIVTIHKTPSTPRWRRHTQALVEKAERQALARETEGR